MDSKKWPPSKNNELGTKNPITLPELLVEAKLSTSKSDAKRLVEQGGVEIAGAVEKDWRKEITFKGEYRDLSLKRLFETEYKAHQEDLLKLLHKNDKW